MALFDFLRSPSVVFMDAVIAKIAEVEGKVEFVRDKDVVAVRRRDGSRLIGLGLLFQEWEKAPGKATQEEIIERAASYAAIPDGMPPVEAAEHLRPVVRRRQHSNDPQAPSPIPTRPLCGELVAMLAVDWPRGRCPVDEALIAQWGISFDTLWENALDRLRQDSPMPPASPLGQFDTLYFGDFYEASRLLLPELFDNQRFRGDPVALPLTQKRVCIAGHLDEAALMALVEAPKLVRDRPFLSAAPIILRDGAWDVIDLERYPRLAFLQPLLDFERALIAEPPPAGWQAI